MSCMSDPLGSNPSTGKKKRKEKMGWGRAWTCSSGNGPTPTPIHRHTAARRSGCYYPIFQDRQLWLPECKQCAQLISITFPGPQCQAPAEPEPSVSDSKTQSHLPWKMPRPTLHPGILACPASPHPSASWLIPVPSGSTARPLLCHRGNRSPVVRAFLAPPQVRTSVFACSMLGAALRQVILI